MAIREILLVDKKTPVISAAACALQCRGYLIMLAPDALTACEDIENYDIDLIMVSLNGYEADKLDLLRQAKRKAPQPKVMVLGNPQTMVYPLKTFRIEVDDYLVTPFTAPELCLRVGKCLGNNRAVDEKVNQGEKTDTFNQCMPHLLKSKIRTMRNAVYSLIAYMNLLIDETNGLINDDITKMNSISDYLITMMNITEDFLGNIFISGEERGGKPVVGKKPVNYS